METDNPDHSHCKSHKERCDHHEHAPHQHCHKHGEHKHDHDSKKGEEKASSTPKAPAAEDK